MLAKTNSIQQQQQSTRRAPLSLSTKPTKSNDKNDNNKKETTSNQKTDNNSKKDSHQERKLSADSKKQQSSMESKRSSSTSSTDSKKLEGNNKINKNDDNKKNQNGVNGNGPKDKLNTKNANESVAKTKPEPSSNGSAAKTVEKKKEPVVAVAAVQNDIKEKPTEQTKETKTEEKKTAEKNKEKTVDVSNSKLDKEKTVDVSNSKLDKEKPKGKNEEAKAEVDKKKNEEKVVEEKTAAVKSASAEKTNVIDQEVAMIILESNEQSSLSTQPQKTEEPAVLIAPVKDKNEEATPSVEKPLLEDDLLEDVMMEPLEFTEQPTSCNIFAVSTPAKSCSPKEAQSLFEQPSKLTPKSEVKPASAPLTHTPDRKSCPRTFSAISGRRSIRPIGDYTFSGNLQIRESYRKINTELDFTSSSLNVTVGSEVPNNESFSFFTRSRKRDRSSPTPQSAMEVQAELSPKSPKRARIDTGMSGFFNAMASPITMLRARLARTSVQSTPKRQIVDSMEQEIVENVSAIAVEAVEEELTATEEQTFNPDSTVADINEPCEEPAKCSQTPAVEEIDDIKIKETITATDSQSKKKCSIM